jgi:pimeloyl-[acyl-carrier protein] methyl ester esterase
MLARLRHQIVGAVKVGRIEASQVQMENDLPTLVLMPGLDGTGLLFERFASALPPGIRTRIIKYPEHAVRLEEHAAVIAEELPAGRVVLLAESFSGLVALYLLSEQKVSVEKVILVASFGSSPRWFLKVLRPLFPVLLRFIPIIPSAAWRFVCLGAAASAADIAWLKGVLAQVNPGVVAHRLELVAAASIPDGPRIGVPAFYLQARGDRLVPHRAAEHLRSLFTWFTVLQVPGPHFLLQSSPSECAQLIAGILMDSA